MFHRKNFMKNHALNPYSNVDGTGNFVSSFKLIKNQSPKYLFELIPIARLAYMARHKSSIPLCNVEHDYFKISFFLPSAMNEWSNLDYNIRNFSERYHCK